MEWNRNIEIMFNKHKIRYIKLNELMSFTENKQKYSYFFIDFDYFINQFLHIIDYYNTKDIEISEELTIQFLTGFLNLIAHYKNYFYNKCDCISFYYIFINNKRYKSNKQLNKMVEKINKILLMIPRIYTIYYENSKQKFFIKYNLMNKINKLRESKKEESKYFNIGKSDNFQLYFRINKNFYQFLNDDNYGMTLYGFNLFRNEHFDEINEIYYNPILALFPVYIVLEELKICHSVRINDVLLKFVKDHINYDFNDPKIHILALKMFTSMKRIENKLKNLENDLNSVKYNFIVEVIMKNWKHVVKDRGIMNINEMFKEYIPIDKRINIEILINN